MGSAVSRSYDIFDNLYQSYYPKSNCLRPAYVSSALLVSKLGADLLWQSSKPVISERNNFLFLTSTGITLGLQLWVTFFSGMTMIRILPRHEFTRVQSQLFPKYFFLTTLMSFLSFSTFVKMNPTSTWSNETLYLGLLIGGSFLLNLVNHAFLSIPTIKYNIEMHVIEKKNGLGEGVVGKLPSGTSLDNNPEYQRVKGNFYKYHGISALANFASFFATIAQIGRASCRERV